MVKYAAGILLFFSCLMASAQAGKVLRINGTGLYVETMGSGEPLLIIHGGPGLSHSYFRPHLDQLAKNYKLVYYDQRASGLSVVPSADSISLKFFAADIEELRKYLGVDKINILAHSWGVIPAVEYAQRYPGKIKKLILVNPVPLNHAYDKEMGELLRSAGTDKDTADRAIIRGSRDFKKGEPDAYRRLVLLSFRHQFYNPANVEKLEIDIPDNFVQAHQALEAGLSGDLTSYDYYEVIKSFIFPVLILAGKSDLIPTESTTQIKTNIPGSTMELYQKSGHFVFVEEPKKFVNDAGDFLSR